MTDERIDIVKAIMKYLRPCRGASAERAWRNVRDGGHPDIIACIDGRFFGFEVKTEDGKPTKLQRLLSEKSSRGRHCAGGAFGGRGANRDKRSLR